jgi:hypothetical protein
VIWVFLGGSCANVVGADDGPIAVIVQRRVGEGRSEDGGAKMGEIYLAHGGELGLAGVEV